MYLKNFGICFHKSGLKTAVFIVNWTSTANEYAFCLFFYTRISRSVIFLDKIFIITIFVQLEINEVLKF